MLVPNLYSVKFCVFVNCKYFLSHECSQQATCMYVVWIVFVCVCVCVCVNTHVCMCCSVLLNSIVKPFDHCKSSSGKMTANVKIISILFVEIDWCEMHNKEPIRIMQVDIKKHPLGVRTSCINCDVKVSVLMLRSMLDEGVQWVATYTLSNNP